MPQINSNNCWKTTLCDDSEINPTIVGIILEFAVCFGKVLRRLRKTAHLTQEQLGFESGLERNFISMLELGQRQPSLHTLFKLSSALGTSPEGFVKAISAELQISSGTVSSDPTIGTGDI